MKRRPTSKKALPPTFKKALSKARVSRTQHIANWIEKWHITRIFAGLSAFLLLPTLLAIIMDIYLVKEERAAREHARVVSAWQLLTTKASGNSGKREAMAYLNEQGHSLAGVDISPPENASYTYLYAVDLFAANLRGAVLNGVDLRGANLKNADLTGAAFVRAKLSGADFSGANVNAANFSGSFMNGVQLNNRHISGVDFARSDLSHARFDGSEIFRTSFAQAYMKGVNFTASKLYSVNFEGAILTDANLQGAALFQTRFDDADIRGADLTGVSFLNCERLTKAKNWQYALRDKNLTCDVKISK
ncbi:Secreted effector protein PipB2 [Paraglaciecola mesophila]|uniref:Secreted effector protein PipB2 n=1 Tax=Paraglaciecola mesophila TaxID=197222 RepID=A0A857JK19_9ALTE|nr:pentapeptide repeat-containing protein [Paraglaciecola mesophila]QHJ11331.1 Secreted effector protein PipB2 [Paraglaciecola mesophila]